MTTSNDLGLSALLHGCEHVYAPEELKRKLENAARDRRQLRVKLGMDPTAPDIHLGHSVVLRKMRQFQDLGHKAVLIIGDFTSRIGDPTGRSKTRPVLTDAEIEANAKTYLDQAGRILDTAPDKLELRHNSEWLNAMNFADVIRLAGKMTVGQMLKREDFRKRFESETPISVHELLYPLAQGWDSVNIRADVELGGTDQTYNNLVGRDLQTDAGQEPQVVIIMPILRGLDGEKKMSKSLGNYIAVTDPPRDVFGKTMSIPDALLEEWFTLLTDVSQADFKAAVAEHPMKAKSLLARKIGERYYAAQEMEEAANWWQDKFSSGRRGKLGGGVGGSSASGAGGSSAGGDPRKTGSANAADLVQVRIPPEELNPDGTIAAWKLCWLAHDREISKSEARRMVEGGAFELISEPTTLVVGMSEPQPEGRGQRGQPAKITDPNFAIRATPGLQFKAGRHRKGERVKQPLMAIVSEASN